MDDGDLRRISKGMALLLRHAPGSEGLVLDAEGYVPLDALVKALQRRMPMASAEAVRQVVAEVEPLKQRYSIVDNCVRANYGHTLAQRISHLPAVPPDVLIHGTGLAVLQRILAEGLQPMKRQYVHLTPDAQLAAMVGQRHGKPGLIRVDAREAHADGVVFYKANHTFWLVSSVAPRYLTLHGAG